MGCNYYLRPKGYEGLKELNNNLEENLEKIRNEYVKNLKDMIYYSNSSSLVYKYILKPEDLDVDHIKIRTEYPFEIPEIHICKISFGWCPCFTKNKYYDSFEKFKYFYITHKYDFDIYDEYNRLVEFEKLEKELFKAKKNAKEDHIQYNGAYGVIKYWKDSDGFDWTHHDFS